jgi:hypothetical protein
MRHLRRTVLATFAVALCAAPAAYAHDREPPGRGAVVAPARGGGLTGGELLARGWSVAPFAAEDPFSGNCATLARNVIAPHFGDDGTATCDATQRTRLFVYFGSACFNVEEGVGETEDEQLACAVAADRAVHEFNVTVDDRETVRLVRRRFEVVSPQTTVPLPPGNEFGVDTATFTAHAWGAVIRRLRPGRHTVAIEVVAPDFGGTFHVTVVLNVVRGGHPDDENADGHNHD